MLLLLAGYSFLAYKSGKTQFTLGDVKGAISSIINPRPAKVTCEVEDYISYLTYTTPSPEEQKNNKFGIYIYAEEERFFRLADELVNSNGGDWGYVLIPFNVRDRDRTRWTRAFSQMREHHLIPVIQLHDINPDDYKDQTEDAAEFLNSFVWPTRSRYISAYNEPNDARFWYGRVDPAEYAKILNYTITTFKKENPDFFILNGALNVSAPTHADGSYLDAFEYMNRMNNELPGIFDRLDGWASHSYPQPEFSGDPRSTGRWSIKAYEEELKYLKNSLGVAKELPVFITETGWAHAEGEAINSRYYTSVKIAEFFKVAFEEVWLKDDRVVAVMPFTIRYNAPFDHFSWIDSSNNPYSHFEVVKSLKKVKGNPPHVEENRTKSVGCF